ncbi:hypothetical protein B0T14DRAFT_499772 [Immersiella caudata]|uniref:Protein kinase domain-containing protein n=1 Tax=Immersiella caudata TaxID=314043 RepID=A0AA39WFN9_9PEZI|nr:hypothetical protein B0T14DRAFT_499772 [Immersiella caudata]
MAPAHLFKPTFPAVSENTVSEDASTSDDSDDSDSDDESYTTAVSFSGSGTPPDLLSGEDAAMKGLLQDSPRDNNTNNNTIVSWEVPASMMEGLHSLPSVADCLAVSMHLDYVVVQLPDGYGASNSLTVSFDQVESIPQGQTSVSVITPSCGEMHGNLEGWQAQMRLPFSDRVSGVYKAVFPRPLSRGDSGSLVINQHTRKVYGHIIAASAEGKVAFIVSSEEVLRDIDITRLVRLTKVEESDVAPRAVSLNHDSEPQDHSDLTVTRIKGYTRYDRGEMQYARLIRSGKLSPDVTLPENLLEKSPPLYDKLRQVMPLGASTQRNRFLPRGYLEEILTEDVVREEIAEGRCGNPSSQDLDRWARLVCAKVPPEDPSGATARSYRRVFAILVFIERVQDIGLIIDDETGICDADLPLCSVPVGPGGYRAVLRRREKKNEPLTCFSLWSSKQHDDFEETQWRVLAPFFAKEDGEVAQFYDLDKNDILPWIYDSGPLHQGGLSFISQVKIHPRHYSFPRPKTSSAMANPNPNGASGERFAVKHFKANLPGMGLHTRSRAFSGHSSEVWIDMKREFEQEIEVLNHFSNDESPHLISLLAAYSKGTDYCLLFPWADYDLKALWVNTSPGPPLDKTTLEWVVAQSLGIASGPRKIHNYRTKSNNLYLGDNRIYGRHGDIKPDNILVFLNQEDPQSRGTLVITDFGLTRFDADHTRTYFGRDIPMTPTYRPPEYDLGEGRVSRSSDIWSYGCVLLEFVTWYLGGSKLLYKFVHQRQTPDPQYLGINSDQFFEVFRSKPEGDKTVTIFARVKVEVLEFVSELRSHENCSETVHSLLDLIIEHMLVVKTKGIGSRAIIEEVYMELQNIHERLSDSSYKLVSAPWKRAEDDATNCNKQTTPRTEEDPKDDQAGAASNHSRGLMSPTSGETVPGRF